MRILLLLLLISSYALGADYQVTSATSTLNCDVFNGGVNPGDILTLDGGSRGPITFQNCAGTSGNEIIIRNNPANSVPTTITSASTGLYQMFSLDDVEHVIVDGLQGWNTMPAGAACGLGSINDETEGQDGCGIIITNTSGVQIAANTGLGVLGATRFVTVQGVMMDATLASSLMYGFTINDQEYCQATEVGEQWREGMTFDQVVVKNSRNSSTYLGSNSGVNGDAGACGTDNIRVRDLTVSNSLFLDSGRAGIQAKSLYDGINAFFNNRVYRTGQLPSGAGPGQGNAIGCTGGDCVAYNNYIEDAGEHGIKCAVVRDAAADLAGNGVMDCTFYNNVIVNSGASNDSIWQLGNGIVGSRTTVTGDAQFTVTAYNNTIVDSERYNINAWGTAQTCNAYDNIAVDAGVAEINGCQTQTNNETGTASAVGFVNYVARGLGFALLDSSGAVDNATGTAPSGDILGVSRPQGIASDQGAFEYQSGTGGPGGPDPFSNIKPTPCCTAENTATFYPSHLWMISEGSGVTLTDSI